MKYTSHIFTQARGRLGGTVFTKGRSGNVLRARVTPAQPHSPSRFGQQDIFRSLTQEWKTLNPFQRTAWTILANTITLRDALGNDYYLTGMQLYVQIGANLILTGQSRKQDAPNHKDDVPTIGTATLDVSAGPTGGAPRFTATLGSAPGGYSLLVKAVKEASPGVSYFSDGDYRVLGSLPAGFSTTPDLLALYTARFGAPKAGRSLSVIFVLISGNGFAGQPVRANALVADT